MKPSHMSDEIKNENFEKKRFHSPVLKDEILQYINHRSSESFNYYDGTAGNGGHIKFFLEQFPEVKIYASDRDNDIIDLLKDDFKESKNINIKQGNYSQDLFKNIQFDYILLDLGISSLHFDYFNRGFSYRYDEILDMRMESSKGVPLYIWLNKAKENEIKYILKEYGEIGQPSRFIFHWKEFIKSREIKTTYDLKNIIDKAYPVQYKKKRRNITNPMPKIFQAFRIFINEELIHLKKAVDFLPDKLNPGGRLFIISFHSLEDRIVKKSFKSKSEIENIDPFRKSNIIPGDFKIITKKPITPSAHELEENPRSRSARLRILEKKG